MKKPTVSHVYVIENEIGLIKIGFASNPDKRFKSIQSASGLAIVKQFISFPSVQAPDLEKRLHQQFAPHRKTGEWFAIAFDDAVDALKALQPDESQQALVPFDFNSHALRTTTDEHGAVWFVAKDVCECLDLSDVSMSLKRLDDDEKLIQTLFVSGQNREIQTINESGLYALIFTSRKAEAKAFKKWVTSEVLPSIRKSGGYGQITPEMQGLIKSAVAQAVSDAMTVHTPKPTPTEIESTPKPDDPIALIRSRIKETYISESTSDKTIQKIRDYVADKKLVINADVIEYALKGNPKCPRQLLMTAKVLKALGLKRKFQHMKYKNTSTTKRVWYKKTSNNEDAQGDAS